MSMCLSTPGTAFFLRIPVRLPGSDRPIAFRLRRLEQTVHRDLGARHFSCKFSRKTSPVAFPRTFRPRRLAQNGLSHFWTILQEFQGSLLEAPVKMKILTEVLVEVLVKMKILMESCHRSLHDLVQYRSSWEDLVDIWLTSSKTSLHDLAQVLISTYKRILWRAWYLPW